MSIRQCISRRMLGGLCLLLCGMTACAPLPSAQPPATTATTTQTTASVATTAATAPTVPSAIPQASPDAAQPALLTSWLSSQGLTYEDLSAQGCEQLVVVSSQAEDHQVHFFERSDGQWRENTRMTAECCVGKNGITSTKREGDGCTPRGLYAIGEAFYTDVLPETGLSSFRITQDTYWVDDPDSRYYNQRVEGTEHRDWNSAERMIEYEVYRYGFVIGFNPQAIYNGGSAIFFHVGLRPTLGCVAADENVVLMYLAALHQDRHPMILIV